MKKVDIIKNDITKTIVVPVIKNAPLSNGGAWLGSASDLIVGFEFVEVVDPTKLAKFFEKHIKTSDLVEELESFQIPPRALDTPATKTREPFPGITTTC